jgi:sphingomyelin phosphodiesterase
LNPGGSTAAATNAFGWNYELLSSLWGNSGWLNNTEQQYASTHYGAYAHTTAQGLRIISINTDFWYTDNIFNYWNITNPDTSGVLAWLASELSACEAKGQRAWIIGHVPSGYDGGNAVLNPSALFYSIVVRFSPTTIAGVFFGHTHEDQIQLFYDFLPNSTYTKNGKTYRNTTMVDYTKPLAVGYIGPSITPLTGNNAGYQLYQVDAATFSITGIQTYFANVSESLTWTVPEWKFEYDARAAYGAAASPNGTWPANAPLNATFWDGVTKSMLTNATLVEMYNLYETKSSVVTEKCSTTACAKQKVCYIRSGSAALGLACGDHNGPF